MNADQREILVKLYIKAQPDVLSAWIHRLSDKKLFDELVKEIKG